MNEFDWMMLETKASEITTWTEHHLREHLNTNPRLTVDTYQFYEGYEPSYRGQWKLYKNNKRYTIECKVKRSDYNHGWRDYESIDKQHYKIGQVIDYLNTKQWVII
jgi:hypothetical protein